MSELEHILGLFLAAVLLAAAARRVGAPYPVFLAVGGALLAFLPIAWSFTLPPELVLALFVAPVLLDSAYDASLRDLKDNWAPVMGLVFALRGQRAFLDEDLVVEDLPSTLQAEMMADNPVIHALTDRRDKRSLDALGEIHAEHGDEPIRVAIVYGAGHVPAIASGLMDRYGYRPREAEWLTVLVQG